QEVQGIRRDVRVINSSLLGTDWYINQLRYKLNDSDPIDPIWSPSQIEGASRDILYSLESLYGNNQQYINRYKTRAGITGDAATPMDLYTMMKDYAGSDDPNKQEQGTDGSPIFLFPSRNVTIPVDVNLVRQNGTVNPEDSVVSQVQFQISKSVLFKNDAAILNIIAANKWKRPIYFTSQDGGGLGFQKYIRQDGLSYRLVPVFESEVNDKRVYDVMMTKFASGNADKPGVYFDEENRRHLNTIRMAYASAALDLAVKNKKEEARKMLNKVDKMMLEENFPYGMASRNQQHNYISHLLVQAAYAAEDTVLAAKITRSLKKDLEQQLRYYESLDEQKAEAFDGSRGGGDKVMAEQLLMRLMQFEEQFRTRNNPPAEKGLTIPTQPVTPGAKPDSPKR
ncbi:MAG TPA: DUF2723 domain-containing protein, partial [Ferruginibacter sp.]|nr:DUF2723 domain-containing protein [Ferruginibacter sp.]